MATLVVTNAAEFPSPMPSMGLVVIDCGTLQIGNGAPLLGTAIVVVRGNVVMNSGNYSNFSGLLYVEGNLTLRAPSEIRGSVICTGNMTVQGSGDYATITFDGGVLNMLMTRVGNYRPGSAIWLPRASH